MPAAPDTIVRTLMARHVDQVDDGIAGVQVGEAERDGDTPPTSWRRVIFKL